MAKVLLLAPSQYRQGLITLFRGDDWVLDANIVDQYNGVNIPTNLVSASGVSAFFPASAGNLPNVAVACAIVDAPAGAVRCTVPKATTMQLGVTTDGISWYLQGQNLDSGAGLETVVSPDQPLLILDPGFT